MPLKIRTLNLGDPPTAAPHLLMIHGWGMHCGVFEQAAAGLADRYRLLMFDLPGHGINHSQPLLADLPALADQLVTALDALALTTGPSALLGWSLGGQLAMTLAQRYPEKFGRLILVASSPRFVAGPDWPQGMAEELFRGFSQDLKADHQGTWRRFLALEVLGTRSAKRDLQHLRQIASAHPAPTAPTLAAGLELLRRTDLRSKLNAIHQATLVLGGSRDRLVPPAAIDWLASRLPNGQATLMAGCGHAPFVGDPDGFSQQVADFLADFLADFPAPAAGPQVAEYV